MKKHSKVLNAGQVINKLELEVARAAMRNDKAAEDQALAKLTQAVNMTSFKHYSA